MFSQSNRKRWTKKIIRTIISILIFPIFLILLPPLLIFICSPIYIFRYLVGKIGPLVNKNIYKIIPARNSFVTIDEIDKSLKYFVGISGILKGEINLENVRKTLTRSLIEATDLSTGQRIYPELTSKIVKFAGFYFWGQDKEFDIKNHVKEYKDPNKKFYEFSDLVQLEKKFYMTPLPENKPIWEFLIVNNFREKESCENQSLFFCKCHHVIGDGFSFLDMSSKFFKVYKQHSTNIPFEKTEFEKLQEMLSKNTTPFSFYLKLIFYSLYEFIYSSVQSTDFNALHPSLFKSREPQIVKSLTKPHKAAQVKVLKEIGKGNGVGMTSVILAGITGGIRRFMIESGVKVPWKIHTGLPIPIPGHPNNKLRHYFSIGTIALPVGISDPFKRLKKIEKKVLILKNSTRPLFNFLILIPMFGGLFPAIIRLINRNFYTTSALSSFPGPKEEMRLENIPAQIFYFDMAFYTGNHPLSINTITYNGILSITLTGNAETFKSDESMERINELILEEFQILHDNIV